MNDRKQEEEIVRYVNENQVTIVNSITCGQMPFYLVEDYKVIVATSEKSIYQKYLATKGKVDSTIYMKQSTVNKFLDYQIAIISYSGNLIQEIVKNKDSSNTVLIIDDSCNCVNADVLIGFVNQLIKEGASLRLVIINKIMKYNERLSKIFDDAPIVNLFPKSYHVSCKLKPAEELENLIFYFVEHSHHKNILVILPEIKDVLNLKKKLNQHYKDMKQKPSIIALFSQSINYGRLKVFNQKVILSTDLAQTMLLNFDIDVVIDTGLEKVWKMIDKVPVLTVRNVSKAVIKERQALAGIFSPGLYFLCSDYETKRKEVGTVIENGIDQMILTMLYYNIDIKSQLTYPRSKYILDCELRILSLLGAIDENTMMITHLGKEISELPFDTRFSRMFIESKKYKLEFDVLICYLLTQLKVPIDYDITDIPDYAMESDLFYKIYVIKKLYFRDTLVHLNESDSKVLADFTKQITKFVGVLGIETTSYEIDSADMKKCLACGFPDSLYILTSKTGYKKSLSSEYSYTISNKHSKIVRGEKRYIVGINSVINRSRKNLSGVTENRGMINLPTVYTIVDVLECFSQHLQLSYSMLDGRNIFRNQTYNGIIISSEFLGTVEDLRLSYPEEFHEEKELDNESGKTVIALYFHDIKVSTDLT